MFKLLNFRFWINFVESQNILSLPLFVIFYYLIPTYSNEGIYGHARGYKHIRKQFLQSFMLSLEMVKMVIVYWLSDVGVM